MEELLLAGLQPALTELWTSAELHTGPVLAEFGIRRLGFTSRESITSGEWQVMAEPRPKNARNSKGETVTLVMLSDAEICDAKCVLLFGRLRTTVFDFEAQFLSIFGLQG